MSKLSPEMALRGALTASVVDGIELGCAFNLPVFPSFSALGRGEAGSYRLPAMKLGKLNSLTPLVSIENPTCQPHHFRLFLAYFLYLIGNTPNIVAVDLL
jgi:hypothetical protein